QPVLVQVHIDGVGDISVVVGPKIDLAEADPIEPLLRQTVEAIAELLGICELAAKPFDDALLAADIKRRAPVPGRICCRHAHRVTGREWSAHRPSSAIRLATSAMRRSSACWSMIPFSTRRRRSDSIPFSK